MKQATSIEEFRNCLQTRNENAVYDNYFVDFDMVRGDFYGKKTLYRALKVDPDSFTYNETNGFNKQIVFLTGNKGTGKSTQIKKWKANLENKECFSCIICNIDKELDMHNVDYIDILLLQMEKLFKRLASEKTNVDQTTIKQINVWNILTLKEINIKLDEKLTQSQTEDTENPYNIFSFFRKSILKNKPTAYAIRSTIKENFEEFALFYNTIIESINYILRKNNIAREILFIVDGLETTHSPEIRRIIIIEEAELIKKIKVNTLFTLPTELLKEEQKLGYGKIVRFPFIKILERNGKFNKNAYTKLEEYIEKRINTQLFENNEIIKIAIYHSGGSPAQLIKILKKAAEFAKNHIVIGTKDLENAIWLLSAETSKFITEKDISILKKLRNINIEGYPAQLTCKIQDLLYKSIVFDYEDGSYIRVNPLIKISSLYKYHVG